MAADLLVLLTDTDGVYTADPRRDPSAALVTRVTADDPLLAIAADGNGSGRGSGGMASKLTAARIASWSGIRSVIARAAAPNVLARAVAGGAAGPGDAGESPVGTTFDAHARTLPARKLWIAFAAEVEGTLQVDAGAERALTRRVSQPPAGGRGGGHRLASRRATPSTSWARRVGPSPAAWFRSTPV